MATITLTPATATTQTPNYATRSYKELLEDICSESGIEPGQLNTQDSLAIRRFINSAMRQFWEYYQWPDLMKIEQTTVANIDNFATYDLFMISKEDPRDFRYPQPYTYSVDSEGINIIDDLATTDTIWLQYRLLFYPFKGDAYLGSTSYALGDMAYDSTTGDYYRSLANSNSGNAVSNTSFWDRRRIPYFLFDATKIEATSKLLKAQGQQEKELLTTRDAWNALNLEIEKWERQKNQQLRHRVRVRSGG
jgi:hypothetical protein